MVSCLMGDSTALASAIVRCCLRSRAMQMLVEQAAFLAEFNDEAAERLVQMFEESAASLSQFPKRAPELNDAYLPPHKGPVDKCQKTAETRSGPGRIGNMQIEKDGACHPFKV